MTGTHWVCTGRAHSPPQPEGVGTASLFHPSSDHKGVSPVHLDDNGARGVKGLVSERHKFAAMSCTTVEALNSAILGLLRAAEA